MEIEGNPQWLKCISYAYYNVKALTSEALGGWAICGLRGWHTQRLTSWLHFVSTSCSMVIFHLAIVALVIRRNYKYRAFPKLMRHCKELLNLMEGRLG